MVTYDPVSYTHLDVYKRQQFTGVDYISLYKEMAKNSEVHFFNNPKDVLKFTKSVLVCQIHTRDLTKKLLEKSGAEEIYGLDEIMTKSVDGSGYNEDYGLLGSNLSTEDVVKLFPRDGQSFVDELQEKFIEKYNKEVEDVYKRQPESTSGHTSIKFTWGNFSFKFFISLFFPS